MEDNVTILFSFCGVDPTIEKDEEKYKYIRNLYSDSKIIKTDRSKLNADCRKIIQGADIIIASEQSALISHEVREEIQIGLEFNLPIFVIREFNDSWLFHEIKGVKEREHIDDIQFMNEIVLKYPQEQGGTSINPSLLRKCSDIFPELPLQFKN